MFKVLGAIFGLGLVILAVFHFVMLHGLTKAMREVVLPRIKLETGVDARVGRLSINMPNGMMFLDDVEIRNPEGFLLENFASIERVEVEVAIKSLFKQKPLLVRNIEVENAVVNVIRNQDGEFNTQKIRAGFLRPEGPPVDGAPTLEAPAEKREPLPEMLFERMWAKARVRYVDFKLNQLDIALDLDLKAMGLSTRTAPDTPWGAVAIHGALGNDKNSFKTELNLRLAPIVDPSRLSFDLTGRVMEIDTRMIQSAYDRLGVRSAPFGIEPIFKCRDNQFQGSELALIIRDIQLEDKLAERIGGMAAIEELRFTVPVAGTLDAPKTDIESGLKRALGDNSRSIIDALVTGQIQKQLGASDPNATISDAAVEKLGEEIKELGENEAAMEVLKDLADGRPSATNQPAPISSDTIVEILGEEIEEIGENEALKEELKGLGKWLFGQ